jgi:AcrR family transcriptional regulator
MPKVINKDEKKYVIMKSAIGEFARSGFEHASLSAIANRTDVGRTAFYSYFKDKRELLDYAVDFLLEIIGSDYRNACDNIFLTSVEKISFLFNKFLTDILSEKEIITVLLEVLLVNNGEFAPQKKKILLRLNSIKKLIEKILAMGIKMGEIKKVDVESMAHTLLLILISLLYSVNTFSTESVKNTVDSFSLLLAGLQTHTTT